MEKAYDLKALVALLKVHGLDVAEDGAKVLVEQAIIWLEQSAVKSPNKIDDLLAPLFGIAKGYVLEQVDKIDGKVG